jgi:hypothetical protein
MTDAASIPAWPYVEANCKFCGNELPNWQGCCCAPKTEKSPSFFLLCQTAFATGPHQRGHLNKHVPSVCPSQLCGYAQAKLCDCALATLFGCVVAL